MPGVTISRSLCLAFVLAVPAPTSSQTDSRDVPFRVVSVSGSEVRIDIGARTARANSLKRATVLTPTGPIAATLVRTERVCAQLCGPDDDQECHFEAVLRTSAPARHPAAVLAGSRKIEAIAPAIVGAEQPTGPGSDWLDADPLRWRGEVYRWSLEANRIYLTSREHGRDVYAPPIELDECRVQAVAPFRWITCPSAQLLYEGTGGVAISFADYGEATVEPLLRLQLDGREAFLIRLGLKGEVTVALLVKEAGQWRVRFRPADYGLLC